MNGGREKFSNVPRPSGDRRRREESTKFLSFLVYRVYKSTSFLLSKNCTGHKNRMICFNGGLSLGMGFQNLPDAKHITVREPDMNFPKSQSYVAVVLGGLVSDACRYAVRLKTAVASGRRA